MNDPVFTKEAIESLKGSAVQTDIHLNDLFMRRKMDLLIAVSDLVDRRPELLLSTVFVTITHRNK